MRRRASDLAAVWWKAAPVARLFTSPIDRQLGWRRHRWISRPVLGLDIPVDRARPRRSINWAEGAILRPIVTRRPVLLIAGRKVVNLQPGANDIRHLAPGVYFVRAKAEGGRMRAEQDIATHKIVIQR
jgi:hypothetical protein